jgi:hypothetical protein
VSLGHFGARQRVHADLEISALTMRLGTEATGAQRFFDTNPGALDEGRLRSGQASADIATVGPLQHRASYGDPAR